MRRKVKKRPRSSKKRSLSPTLLLVLIGGTLATAGSVGFSALPGDRDESSHAVIYPVPYSDSRITQNAIIADPRFSAMVATGDEGILANIIAAIRNRRVEPVGEFPISGIKDRGTWLWTPTREITPRYRDQILSGAKENDINVIYLSIDSYLDIYALPEGPEKKQKKKAFDHVVKDFIAHANAMGIAVDAEAGWRNWAEPGHAYKAKAVIEYAINFNNTHLEKFRGFQYDVEPYLLSIYPAEKEQVLRHFVALVDVSIEWLYGSNLLFSVAIPDFYDGSDGAGEYFYGLRRDHTIGHLFHVLERRPGSSIIVMAYRNLALGRDGAIAITEQEMEVAKKFRTKVIVAQEVGDVLPPFITFHKTSRAHYATQLSLIENAFAANENFGGLSVHFINPLLTLR